MSKTSNHERAPICAGFVQEMRTCFPELVVLYVSENGFELGERDPGIGVVATQTFVETKKKK